MFEFPWEKGEIPFFVNEQGAAWYKYQSLQDYINLIKLKNAYAFYVRKDKEVDIVVIDLKQSILFAGKSLEAAGAKMDILKVLQDTENK